MYYIQVAPARSNALNLEEQGEINTEALRVLFKFPEITSKREGLPPWREGFDHAIILQTGTNPVNIRPYRYSAVQKSVIEELVEDMLQQGIIRTSKSSFASPVVLVEKKNGGWRICVDYREFNKATVKNRYPIPLIEDLFDEFGGCESFFEARPESWVPPDSSSEGDTHKIEF